MRIAFHTPLNPLDDDRISGDRRMARQLVQALESLGHEVAPVTGARAYMATPDPGALAQCEAEAAGRRDALLAGWAREGGAPELWFTYHSYYKAPDLLGPALAAELAIPYAAAEASDSRRREQGEWARHVALSRDSFAAADLHVCFTQRDRQSIEPWRRPGSAVIDLPPFIVIDEISGVVTGPDTHPRSPPRPITVAMMRPGVKLESYRALAAALKRLADMPWTLTIIGDGPERRAVEAAFAGIPAARVAWRGALDHQAVKAELADHDIFVWPGLGEAYGLVYLEAQAAGLPVVAFDSGGVPATVRRGETALLVPERDEAALARAFASLLANAPLRARMGDAARHFVLSERTLERAGEILAKGLALALASHGAAP